MIYTITLNPAVDYVVYTDELQKGNIMRSTGENVFIGGKGINVSLILKEHGVDSVAMGFLAGFTGKAIEDGLNNKKIANDFVHLKKSFTRINIKIRANEETDINGRGPEADKTEIEELFNKLKCLKDDDILVIAGSVPDNLPDDIYEQILKQLSDKKIRFVVDAEKGLLVNSLKYKPFLIKPNNDELGEIFNTEINSINDAVKYAQKLKEQGALNVIVSMGASGSVLLDENMHSHYMEAVPGKVVNTVGAGDSMVGGFIAGYEKTRDYNYALMLASASGSATAFSEGIANIEKIKECLNILK